MTTDLVIEEAEPKMQVHSFTETLIETPVLFHIVVMKNSTDDSTDTTPQDAAWVWVGSPASQQFKELAVAMNTRFNKKPIGTDIIGWNSGVDRVSKNIAERLAQKFKKVVFYVSYNLDTEMSSQAFAEKQIATCMKLVLGNK